MDAGGDLMLWIDDLIKNKPVAAKALIDHDGSELSYGDLAAAVEKCAEVMQDLGVRPGDRVVVVAENSAVLVAVFLATARLRAWCVPANARITGHELDAICADAGPRLTVFTCDASVDAKAHAERLGASEGPQILGRALIVLTDPLALAEPVHDDPAQQVASLIYTSGSTGSPKGVMLSHGNLMFNALTTAKARGFSPEDVIVLALPSTHIMALSTVLLAGMAGGATVRLQARFTAQGLLAALTDGGTVMTGVPPMFEQMLRHIEVAATPFHAPRLRLLGAGGAPLDPALKMRVEARFGVTLNNGYGLTEAAPGVSSTVFGPERNDGSIGYVYPHCTVRIDAPGKDGVGELLFKGPGVMLGYYHNPQATAEVMTSDGYLRTGDLARMDADGALHLVGRSKELIIRSGFNVYPPEVEAALMACPGVVQAAVAGRRVDGNEEVLAFVTHDGSTDTDAIALRLRDTLAPYKRPQQIIVVSEMPLTSAGKIRKPALLEQMTIGRADLGAVNSD